MAPAEAAAAAASLVGSYVLYWFPDYGWQLGSVAKLSKRTPEFSHVVVYSRAKAAFAGTADSFLDLSFCGTRWVLLSPDTSPVAHSPSMRRGRRAAGQGD